MYDNSTKSLMVDERQVTRDVLDNLFEKTHCDCNVNWCLYEMYPELQIGKWHERAYRYSASYAIGNLEKIIKNIYSAHVSTGPYVQHGSP